MMNFWFDSFNQLVKLKVIGYWFANESIHLGHNQQIEWQRVSMLYTSHGKSNGMSTDHNSYG